MKQPSPEQRSALKALWQSGQGLVASYLMMRREAARDEIEKTEGKPRDVATGEAKAMRDLLDIMSGQADARPIAPSGDAT